MWYVLIMRAVWASYLWVAEVRHVDGSDKEKLSLPSQESQQSECKDPNVFATGDLDAITALAWYYSLCWVEDDIPVKLEC